MLGVFPMKEYLRKKQLNKALFILIISLFSLASFMLGGITILKLGVYSSVINGSSMEKTFSDGTKILVVNASLGEIKRGDLVSVGVEDPIYGYCHYAKRIIGLPNETINIKEKNVYIDDNILEEPYAYYREESVDDFTFKLGENQYFIMGDNRSNSYDSRGIGPIDKDDIVSIIWKYKE